MRFSCVSSYADLKIMLKRFDFLIRILGLNWIHDWVHMCTKNFTDRRIILSIQVILARRILNTNLLRLYSITTKTI